MAAYTTIDNPELYFQVKTYTGNGSTNAITLDGSEDMQPDLVWIKNRSNAASHAIQDSVRGNDKTIRSNNTGVEYDNSFFTSFDSDGFTLTSDETDANDDGHTLVAWCWKAGTTSGITSTGADITSSAYSFNTTSKFGIGIYTGNGTNPADITHACAGGTAVPEFILTKCRDFDGREGVVYHEQNTSAPETEHLELEATTGTQDTAWSWNDTKPTAVYFTVQSNSANNKSGTLYVSYSWRGVQGFSKFGAYTGNGNADGTFVYTGFRPAFVLNKRTNSTANWVIHDNKRTTFNVCNAYLKPNTTAADTDDSGRYVDLLSNGFKWRGTDTETNHSGSTYIYAAFAEQPFVNSNGVPCNAR